MTEGLHESRHCFKFFCSFILTFLLSLSADVICTLSLSVWEIDKAPSASSWMLTRAKVCPISYLLRVRCICPHFGPNNWTISAVDDCLPSKKGYFIVINQTNIPVMPVKPVSALIGSSQTPNLVKGPNLHSVWKKSKYLLGHAWLTKNQKFEKNLRKHQRTFFCWTDL